MRALRADLYLAITIIVVAAIYLHADAGLRSASIGDPLGPKAFPALVGGGLILSALLLLFETWGKRRALADTRIQPRTRDQKHVVLVLAGMIAWTALYYYVFESAGYLIATPVFLFGLLSYFNKGRHLVNVLVAVCFTATVYLLFSILLGVPLPTGPLDL
ncbi:MAG TPA: tripartite tricarboxylate transporter TctB family protein [Dongiaceae bacterium]|jgi:putative tricarboxylic transport membrane protein|nr:tripartite tricarboxylate transporter TctB family protein [Dongiaceae bacterium]